MMKLMMKLAGGNPGAVIFAAELVRKSQDTINKLIELDIIGTHAYVLYSDICNKDINLLFIIMDNCSDDILINASHRQDYSGRNIPEIKHIVDAYNVFTNTLKESV